MPTIGLNSRSHKEAGHEFALDERELATRQTIYQPNIMEGKRIVVSGAGSGIGKATALLFARLGADVAVCGRREQLLNKTCDLISDTTGREAMKGILNIRDADSVENFIADVHNKLGGIDILINNAGGQYVSNAVDISRKGWNAVIDTNLNGTWWMMQEAAKQWIARNQPGSIINVTAVVERGCPQVAHTCAARAGVIYASKTVALEWAPHHIRVNCLAPGATQTEGFRQYPKENLHEFYQNPMRRTSDAFEMAETMVYMASPAAAFMTGEVVTLDGGQQLWGNSWLAGRPKWFNDDWHEGPLEANGHRP